MFRLSRLFKSAKGTLRAAKLQMHLPGGTARAGSVLRQFLGRPAFERDLDDEMRHHLEQRIAHLQSRGISAAEAARQARLEFGNRSHYVEECRRSAGFTPFDHLRQDLRFAFRLYARSPRFSALAVLSLAIGMGVNTSLFSMMNFLLLKPMPVPQAEQVVVLSRGQRTEFSYPDYRDFSQRTVSFSSLAASNPTESSLDLENEASSAGLEAVSGNYAATLRLGATLGRWFNNEDEPVAVISHAVWQRRFHSDPHVIGKVIRSERRFWTVIGVAQPEFPGTYAPLHMDLWVPLRQWVSQHPNLVAAMEDRRHHRLMLFGRLKDGATAKSAEAELNTIDLTLWKETGRNRLDRLPIEAAVVQGLAPAHFRRGARPISILLLGVGLGVLLIASLNVANLLLAKGMSRQTELGLRLSLGAGPSRVFRQMLAEALLLAAIGAGLGLLFGHWTNRLLPGLFQQMPFGEGIRLDLGFDYRTFAYTAVVAIGAMLVAGVLPAWRASRLNPLSTIKGSDHTASPHRWQRSLLIGQLALSLTLLSTAGMFLHSWVGVRNTDPGFAVNNRLFAQLFVSEPEFNPQQAQRFYAQSVDALRNTEGITAAAQTGMLPLSGQSFACVAIGEEAPLRVTTNRIGDGYFGVLEIPLERGRDFAPASTEGVIVNQTLAHKLWGNADPAGQTVRLGCEKPVPAQVIGVARDSKILTLTEDPQPHLYQPMGQAASGLMTLVLSTNAPQALIAERVRTVLRKPGIRVYGIKPLADHIEMKYWHLRWEASILAIFGFMALLLAAVGLYGAMSYFVAGRTRELGIRMALGASASGVVRLVASEGIRLALPGIAAGCALSVLAGSLLHSMLVGVERIDLPSLAGASILWAAVVLAASVIPGWRIASIAPSTALRHE